MTISLKNNLFELWKTNYLRRGIQSEFKPSFIRYIGVEKQEEYNSVLKTLVSKSEEDKEYTIYFDNQIPFVADFDFLTFIKKELEAMNVRKLSNEDIKIFQDITLNQLFLDSLEYTVNKAIDNENFFSNNVRNDFVCKMLLFSYYYISKLNYSDTYTNKCIYYGNITKHEIYFLLLLYKMGFDVLYINPLKEDTTIWETIDTEKLSTLYKEKQILPVKTLKDRVSKGDIIQLNSSITLSLENQIESSLFTNGIYKPWQFKDGYTKSLFTKGTIIDIEQNWTAPAKVRAGFKVEDKIVTIPNLFYEIEGEYKDLKEYKQLVNFCSQSEQTFVINNGEKLIRQNSLDKNKKFELMFCFLSDGTFNKEDIKKLDFYNFSLYNDLTEDFILDKINETIKDKSLFVDQLNTNEKIIDFVWNILLLKDEIVQLIDSFDFVNDIPKLTIFLNEKTVLSKEDCYVLGFLNKIGIDIIVFSPAGLSDIQSYISTDVFSLIRLEKMNYEENYNNLKTLKKEGLFKRFFK